MVRIAPVNLGNNPKTLWFDAGDLEINEGEGVVVTTARGTEFGRLADVVFEATEDQVEKLKSPLKPVLRVASLEDEAHAEDMMAKSAEALPVFKEMAAEMNEGMRPVSVEYLFDGDKAIFYFEAEDRVDFRELVRKLAAHFHVRIDMRQIGVRDEARLIGGLGHCGQELCCKRLGGEFCPVSIRMAKEQDLSLNPQKISGVCGRLMCCLRYEYDAYKDFNKRAPKRNATVQTPDGPAKVVDLDVPREIVVVRIEGEKPVRVPLSTFEPVEGEGRPSVIGGEAWADALEQSSPTFGSAATTLLTGQLSASDKLADPKAVRRTGSAADKKAQEKQDKQEKQGKGSKRGSKQTSAAAKSQSQMKAAPKGPLGRRRPSAAVEGAVEQEVAAPTRTPRRRRSTKLEAGAATLVESAAKKPAAKGEPASKQESVKPVAKPASKRGAVKPAPAVAKPEQASGDKAAKAAEAGESRKPRRRARSGAEQRKRQQESKRAQQGQTGGKPESAPVTQSENASREGKPAVRPGQKSSGVRRSHEVRTGASNSAAPVESAANAVPAAEGAKRPRRRRRNRKPSQESGQQE